MALTIQTNSVQRLLKLHMMPSIDKQLQVHAGGLLENVEWRDSPHIMVRNVCPMRKVNIMLINTAREKAADRVSRGWISAETRQVNGPQLHTKPPT